MIKQFIVNNFPAVGKYKRYLVALRDSRLSPRASYSQHGEDVFICDTLSGYDMSGAVYVDIGANHPTDISNTFLLYTKGYQGIIIEPNEELAKLFVKFRKRDIPLMIGCSNSAAVLPFNISKTPVISSFGDNKDINVYRTVYLPVMRVDDALRHMNVSFISLLSIDVEGLNIEVMEGGTETIRKSLLVCVEFDTEADKLNIAKVLGNNFELLKMVGCNVIYLNKELALARSK